MHSTSRDTFVLIKSLEKQAMNGDPLLCSLPSLDTRQP